MLKFIITKSLYNNRITMLKKFNNSIQINYARDWQQTKPVTANH